MDARAAAHQEQSLKRHPHTPSFCVAAHRKDRLDAHGRHAMHYCYHRHLAVDNFIYVQPVPRCPHEV
eukprot:4164595-Pleurochrysis_carterae.AAC.2